MITRASPAKGSNSSKRNTILFTNVFIGSERQTGSAIYRRFVVNARSFRQIRQISSRNWQSRESLNQAIETGRGLPLRCTAREEPPTFPGMVRRYDYGVTSR